VYQIFLGRIAGMLVPQIMLLESHFWKPLPFLLCSILAATCGLLHIFLPETLNEPLPETPEDVDNLCKKEKRRRLSSNSFRRRLSSVKEESKNAYFLIDTSDMDLVK